jgi:hypothetical protein
MGTAYREGEGRDLPVMFEQAQRVIYIVTAVAIFTVVRWIVQPGF